MWEKRNGGVAKRKGRDDEEELYRATQGFIQISQRESRDRALEDEADGRGRKSNTTR